MTSAATIAPPELDELCVNTLRFLAVDAVQKAKSGHPGLPLGSAAMAYALWDRSLNFNPRDPLWPDRDRFILSAGHGSASASRRCSPSAPNTSTPCWAGSTRWTSFSDPPRSSATCWC